MSLIVFGLLVVYIGGAWKFWKGYNRTIFNRTVRHYPFIPVLASFVGCQSLLPQEL